MKSSFSPNGAVYPLLKRGDVVVALAAFDPEGADVSKGMTGVCFEEANFFGDGAGPMVRWCNGGMCNVYSDFCVEVDELVDAYLGRRGGVSA